MDLSIIIPSYNTKALLDRCLTSVFVSLSTSKLSYEVIVVDNASKDGTPKLLKTKYPRVISILNSKNVGYGKANNQATRLARGTYILLINSDILVQGRAIENITEFGVIHSSSFIGGKLFNEDQTPQASCGPFYTLGVVFLMLFCKGDALGITRYSPTQIRRVDWVSGACLFGSKKSFEEVGLFDEDIFLYMEEIEFLYRARQKGYEVLFFPDAHFIHTGAASSGGRIEPVKNIYKGLVYVYSRHKSIIEQRILYTMLYAKAIVAIAIGRIAGRQSIATTYEETLSVLQS